MKTEVSTEFANFLAKAYHLPAHLLAAIFDMSADMTDRNTSILLACFMVYSRNDVDLEVFKDKDVAMNLIKDKFESFLADAVMRTFIL